MRFLKLNSNCPVIWVFLSRTLNNKINRLHERSLRIMYITINSVSILHNNIHTLAT